MRRLIASSCISGLALLLVACGPVAVPEPGVTPGIISTASTQAVSTSPGQQVFITKGCSTCHGASGEGTSIAPALAGHTAEQIERQVRAPVGSMPPFPPEKISDIELAEIIEFIEHLEGELTRQANSATAEGLAMHHSMALSAIDTGELPEAMHHLEHVIEMSEGRQLERAQEAMRLLRQGKVQQAERIIEAAAASLPPTNLKESQMHLTMASSALKVEDATGALHHMVHYVDMADREHSGDGQQVMKLIQEGRLHDAEHRLEQFMGSAPAAGSPRHDGAMHAAPTNHRH